MHISLFWLLQVQKKIVQLNKEDASKRRPKLRKRLTKKKKPKKSETQETKICTSNRAAMLRQLIN